MNPPELITVLEAAALLNCSRTTIFNMMKKKDFPSVKVKGLGRRIIRERLLPWVLSPAANKPAKTRVAVDLIPVPATIEVK